MRLRRLTEAECYARCYGGRSAEAALQVRVAHDPHTVVPITERDRELIQQILRRTGFDSTLKAA